MIFFGNAIMLLMTIGNLLYTLPYTLPRYENPSCVPATFLDVLRNATTGVVDKLLCS